MFIKKFLIDLLFIGLLPKFSTAIADIQQPRAAVDKKSLSALKPVAIKAKSESPAPEISSGFTDREGNDCPIKFPDFCL